LEKEECPDGIANPPTPTVGRSLDLGILFTDSERNLFAFDQGLKFGVERQPILAMWAKRFARKRTTGHQPLEESLFVETLARSLGSTKDIWRRTLRRRMAE
jgi:hypothetical protein